MSLPGPGALDQQRPPAAVAAQQPHGAVAVPERERVGLLVRLVVLGRRHLQHRVLAGRRHVRVARQRKRRPELDAPLRGDLRRDQRERLEVGRAHTRQPYPS